MNRLRVLDRVRWARKAAIGFSDGHGLLGTVVGSWIDPDGFQRIDVAFDGEDEPVPAQAASNYELTE